MSNATTRLPRAVWLMDRNELENEVAKLRAEGDDLESALAQAREELANARSSHGDFVGRLNTLIRDVKDAPHRLFDQEVVLSRLLRVLGDVP